jgi:hypothetical protein
MAVLTAAEKAGISEQMARLNPGVNYTKPVAFAAIQAVEDWFEANRSGLNQAINAATTAAGGSNLTVAQKKYLVSEYLLMKAGKERS